MSRDEVDRRLEAAQVALRAVLEPDNHHNAYLCPYCNTQRDDDMRSAEERGAEAVRKAVEGAEVYYVLQYRIWSGPGSVDAPGDEWTEWKDSTFIGDHSPDLDQMRLLRNALSQHPETQYRITRHTVEVVE